MQIEIVKRPSHAVRVNVTIVRPEWQTFIMD